MFRILFPTDFSKTTDHALQYLLNLISTSQAKIDLLHVHHSGTLVKKLQQFGTRFSTLNHFNNIQARMEHLSERIPEEFRGDNLIEVGAYPSSLIVETSKDRQSDLICMGLRDEFIMSDRILGTITARTLDAASCPVLAVPDKAQKTTPRQVLSVTNSPADHLKESMQTFWVDLQLDLKSTPILHTISLSPTGDQGAYNGIYKILQSEKIDAIHMPRKERDLLSDLYYNAIPRSTSYRTKLPLFLI